GISSPAPTTMTPMMSAVRITGKPGHCFFGKLSRDHDISGKLGNGARVASCAAINPSYEMSLRFYQFANPAPVLPPGSNLLPNIKNIPVKILVFPIQFRFMPLVGDEFFGGFIPGLFFQKCFPGRDLR